MPGFTKSNSASCGRFSSAAEQQALLNRPQLAEFDFVNPGIRGGALAAGDQREGLLANVAAGFHFPDLGGNNLPLQPIKLLRHAVGGVPIVDVERVLNALA